MGTPWVYEKTENEKVFIENGIYELLIGDKLESQFAEVKKWKIYFNNRKRI